MICKIIVTLAGMNMDSKLLFQRLMSDLTLSESKEEKEAIVLWVLENQLKLSQAEVMAGKSVTLDEAQLNSLILRLNSHEPVQYVLGESEFYGRKYIVTADVLIPRPETELLVKEIVEHGNPGKAISILDIGTGSGSIAISLALELPLAKVIALDVSERALAVARKNAQQLQAHVNFFFHDILETELPLTNLDVIASNPPYIPIAEKNSLQRNVRDFEPAIALFVNGSDPLQFHKAISKSAMKSLQSGGLLITEIHEAWGHETAAVFESEGLINVNIIKDLFGKDRLVTGIKP